MKFLIVDDSPTMRRIMANALQRIGYTDIIEAVDGPDALGRFDHSVSVVITDWHMPRMSGVEFARAVRAMPGGESALIMLVTSRGARDDIIAAIDAGVNSYILRPFTPSVLREKIDRLLTSAEV